MKEREFKKEYKNFFNSIYISNDKKKIIMDNIIDNKKKKVFFLKPSMAILMLFMTIFLGITVYAAVNSELFNTLVVKYKERKDGEKDVELSSSAIKEINYQADVSQFDKNGKYKIYSTSEIEKLLGIKILKSGIFKNQNMYINAMEKDKNNNIGYIGINYQETASSNNNFIVGWFKVHITTKYAESKNVNENVNLFWSHDAKEIFIKNLNTKAMVSKDSDSSFRCRFDYDNIKYNILVSFINFNTFSEDEKLKKISDFFETLSY